MWLTLRIFGLDGKLARPKVVQEIGNGLVAMVCVLINPSFYAPLFFSCVSLLFYILVRSTWFRRLHFLLMSSF